MLEVAGLAKTYPGGDQVLCGVSLTVKATEVVFVIGPSGAGKSTLIRCINRLVEPDAGSVRLDGVEITRLTGADLRRARRHKYRKNAAKAPSTAASSASGDREET